MSAKSLSLKKALDFLSGRELPGNRRAYLVKMHTNANPEGFSYYVIPGGHVRPETAASLLKRPDIRPSGDGLFPGNDQTWSMA